MRKNQDNTKGEKCFRTSFNAAIKYLYPPEAKVVELDEEDGSTVMFIHRPGEITSWTDENGPLTDPAYFLNVYLLLMNSLLVYLSLFHLSLS